MVSMDQFRDTYLNECAELLAQMEERLVSLNPAGADNETLNAIFRCAHSIKGGAGAFGFTRVTAFTHVLESLLDSMREGRVQVSEAVVGALLQSVDVVTTLLQSESTGAHVPPEYGQQLADDLKRLSGSQETVASETTASSGAPGGENKAEAKTWRIRFAPHENLFLTGNDPLLLLRELETLGQASVRADVTRVPELAALQVDQCVMAWEVTLTTVRGEKAIREVFEFVDGNCDLQISENAPEAPVILAASAAPTAANSNVEASAGAIGVTSIRVDLEKIDRLVNMVGELVITQAMLYAQTRPLPVEQYTDLLRGVDDLAQHTRELQEAVMAVRMQPVKSIFSRMPRIVRDIAQQLGKEIRLVTSGEQTEVDKTIIEQLSDPLTHMIRNAADHGIELPDVREAAGKPRMGTVMLNAYHQGGRILIEVSEDGAGLNREKILSKAREKNLIAQDAQLSDEAIEQLIFLPGFSTAEQVSNISGRGVGMDVVKRNISAMGGMVSVKSEPGKGSRFTVSLPLTLAILDGMIVRVGAEYYIIPITSIIETMRPRAGDVHAVPDGHDVLNVRGEFVPVVYLHALFHISNSQRDASKALVVLVETGREKLGLVVDELIGQQQVVIKSLEENADPVRGISGATILGDGKVSLILDIAGLQGITANVANSDKREATMQTQHEKVRAHG